MNIETTYVLSEEIIGLLREAEEKTGWDRVHLIVMVMRMMRRDQKNYTREFGRIEYQKRFDEEGRKIIKYRVKVEIREQEYDYFQDMRKFFRRSISLLIAIAMNTYLALLVEKILAVTFDEDRDSYPFQNYAITEKCIENITCFCVWWGLPLELETLYQ